MSEQVRYNRRTRKQNRILVVVLFSFLLGFIYFIPLIGLFVGIVLLIPTIAVSVRRLHDIGKSGLWYLLILIPIIGAIILLIIFMQPSQEGDNEYGENPN